MLKAFIFVAFISLGLAGAAAAQNCPAYPYTLTNGATADANQVMSNFNNIRTCANLLAPLANPQITGTLGLLPGGNIASDSNTTYVRGQSGVEFQSTSGSQYFAYMNVGGISTSNLWLTGGINAPSGGVNATSYYFSSAGGNMAADTQNVYVRGVSGIAFQDAAATTTYGYMNTNNTSGLWINGVQYYSDARLKTNIQNFTGGLNALDQLRPVRYNFRAPADRSVGKKLGLATTDPQIGLIAQEVGAVVPEAVATDKDGIYGVKENVLIPVLIDAIKELHVEVEALKAQISAQQKNNH